MTDGAASGSVSFESRVAHALARGSLDLAGGVRVADVHVQTGHLCARTIVFIDSLSSNNHAIGTPRTRI